MKALQELWDLAAELAQENEETSMVFDSVGLCLQMPLVNYAYHCTPVNSSTFATTRGDGVHFGLLHIDGEVIEKSPIIMTVPCNFGGEYNFVVGNDLHDFLCLGCRTGYFSLEDLVWEREELINELKTPNAQSHKDARLLQHLVTAFDLRPWNSFETKLEQLKKKYLPLLQLPPED